MLVYLFCGLAVGALIGICCGVPAGWLAADVSRGFKRINRE
jgi:hypothetical protein